MAWRDLYRVLTTCCSPEEKQLIWEGSREHADQLHAEDPGSARPAAEADPDHEPGRDRDTPGGTEVTPAPHSAYWLERGPVSKGQRVMTRLRS